jgi:hypothetical protein
MPTGATGVRGLQGLQGALGARGPTGLASWNNTNYTNFTPYTNPAGPQGGLGRLITNATLNPRTVLYGQISKFDINWNVPDYPRLQTVSGSSQRTLYYAYNPTDAPFTIFIYMPTPAVNSFNFTMTPKTLYTIITFGTPAQTYAIPRGTFY